jgi:creatinine amidohydrolase
VFVNGHGGNATAMARATDTLAAEDRRALVWWPTVPGGDLHAGHVETSLMLALAPEQVRLDRAVAGPIPAVSELVSVGVQTLSASGVLGDPTGASVEEGRRLFDELTAQLVAAVARRYDR